MRDMDAPTRMEASLGSSIVHHGRPGQGRIKRLVLSGSFMPNALVHYSWREWPTVDETQQRGYHRLSLAQSPKLNK